MMNATKTSVLWAVGGVILACAPAVETPGDGDGDTTLGDGDGEPAMGDGDGEGDTSSGTGGADSGSGGVSTGGSTAQTGGSPGTGGSDMQEPTPSSGCEGPTSLVSGRASIDVNGTEREYILHIPEGYVPSQAYRLVFAWHQLSGSAESIANRGYYGLEDASAGQAILVAPEGLVGNENGDRGWWDTDDQDTEFYFALLDLLTSELCIDEERIFSTGFSFGAMFSFALACNQDSLMRAIAPQAGSVFGGCGNGARPVATFGFIGTDDSLLDGHRNGISAFAERNGCASEPVEMSASWCEGLDDNNMPCTCWEYQECSPGYPVIECEYNAGHTFAPNSGQTIWDFFSQF